MKDKIIVNIKKIDEIDIYNQKGLKNFLVPLKNFCVGYDEIELNDILKIKHNFYLLINRILDNKALNELEKELKKINTIYLKGIFFEDLGVLSVIDKSIEKIYFPNHFATNYLSINAFLKRGIDSVVISNEITLEEIEEILKKVDKNVILPVYGYNQIMYSRRNLITNYNKEFNLKLSLNNEIKEQVTHKKLKIKENEFGTIIFDEHIYNNLTLLNLKENIKFYYINTTFLEIDEIFKTLENKNEKDSNSFLNKKTVYKIGDLDE